MSTISRRISIPVAILIALVAAPTVTGCSMVQGIIEEQTGGKVDLGGKSIPADFPTADVPLVAGDIVYGAGITTGDGQVWNVTINVAGANPYDSISTQLTGAGFSAQVGMGGSTDDGGAATFDSAKYGVAVLISKDGSGKFVVNYTVTTIK